ncbi:MAG: M48 family metallopeptidase [Asticcacaulis sp.]|nr:M48 family metallopeptidase [Asticcacaulis sp.]
MAQEQTAANLDRDMPERIPGARPDPKSLEGGIWADSAKAERLAKTSGERDTDPALEAYISGVEAGVAGPFAGDIRMYVMDRPFFNASVSPNGYGEVWSGLLLRCETEDELAFVLGHETGHFRHSHGLKRYQEVKSGSNAAMVAMLVIGVAAAASAAASTPAGTTYRPVGGYSGTLIDLTYLGTIAVLMGYSRDTEAQADAYGLIYENKAGYFTGSGAALWTRMIEETQASDYEKVRRLPTRTNVFGSHPLESDRITLLNALDRQLHGGALASQDVAEAKAARAAYRAHVRPYLGRWLKDDLRRQDYGQTLYLIDHLSVDGEDAGLLNFYRGEALRLRGHTDDLPQALAAYKAALKSPDAPVETWRQLGDVYRHAGQTTEAQDAYRAYLAAAPTASDAWMIQDEIDTIAKTTPAETPPPVSGAAPAPEAAPSNGGATT